MFTYRFFDGRTQVGFNDPSVAEREAKKVANDQGRTVKIEINRIGGWEGYQEYVAVGPDA